MFVLHTKIPVNSGIAGLHLISFGNLGDLSSISFIGRGYIEGEQMPESIESRTS
jgi:hypothetical protein